MSSTSVFQVKSSGNKMENVLSKMHSSTGRISKNFPESSQHAAQTIYPFELQRYMLHFVRNCCVKCWQANGYCVIWFFFNARRATTVFLPSTLTTCLTSNQNASRIAASTRCRDDAARNASPRTMFALPQKFREGCKQTSVGRSGYVFSTQ